MTMLTMTMSVISSWQQWRWQQWW